MLKFLIRNKSETFISTTQKKQNFINEFFELVKAELPKAYIIPNDIHQSKNELVFNAKPFRHTWNGWNLFNPVIRGEWQFKQVSDLLKLETRMYFTEFFITAALLSLASIPGFVTGAFVWSFAWLILLWGIFYAGSRLLHSVRLKIKIKQLIRETENPQTKTRSLHDVWQEDRGFVFQTLSPLFSKKSSKKKK